MSLTLTIGDRAAVVASAVAGVGSNTWGGTAALTPQTFLAPATSVGDIGHGTATRVTSSNLGSVTITHNVSGASKLAAAVWQ